MRDLSVLIPARNELFLKPTVEDVLSHAHADTEIIVIADGGWPIEGLPQHERVTVVHHPVAIGQRSVNLPVKFGTERIGRAAAASAWEVYRCAAP